MPKPADIDLDSDADDEGKVWYLREWREYRKMTQQQLADLVNAIDGNTKLVGNDVSRIERGDRGFTLRFQRAWPIALRVQRWQLQRLPTDPTLDQFMIGATDQQWDMARRFLTEVLGLKETPPTPGAPSPKDGKAQ